MVKLTKIECVKKDDGSRKARQELFGTISGL